MTKAHCPPTTSRVDPTRGSSFSIRAFSSAFLSRAASADRDRKLLTGRVPHIEFDGQARAIDVAALGLCRALEDEEPRVLLNEREAFSKLFDAAERPGVVADIHGKRLDL